MLAELHVGGRGFELAHYWVRDVSWVGGGIEKKRGETRTIGVDSAILTFGDVEEVWPAGKIREVEVQVIGLSQRVEVGGVEFEDVGSVEGSQGSHPAGFL